MLRLAARLCLSGSIAVLCACSAAPSEPAEPGARPAPAPAAPSASGLGTSAAAGDAPPIARKETHTVTLHGLELKDDYHWLRNKGTPEVVAYLEAENAHTRSKMKATEPFQETLYKEMLGRIQETDLSVPYKEGEYYYYSRTEQGKQYPIHCRKKKSLDAKEEVILDLNELAKATGFVGIGPMEVSSDGNLLAVGVDTSGFRQFVLQFKDLRTGEMLPEKIERVRSVAWASDGKTVHYVVEDPGTKRFYRLHRHVLGTKVADDPLVFEEKDARFNLWVRRSRSQALVLVTSSSATTTEVRFVRADRPKDAFTVIAPREQDHEYYVDHRGDSFYIQTNSGGRNFRLVTARVSSPGRDKWKEVLPHRDDVMLERAFAFEGHVVLLEREAG